MHLVDGVQCARLSCLLCELETYEMCVNKKMKGQGPHFTGKTLKNGPKHRLFGNFVKTQAIHRECCVLKIKDIGLFPFFFRRTELRINIFK